MHEKVSVRNLIQSRSYVNSKHSLTVRSPASGKVLSTYATSVSTHFITHLPLSLISVMIPSEDDINRTVRDAHDVFKMGVWSRLPALERSATLTIMARDLEEMVPDLARKESEQTGRTIREMMAQLSRIPEWLWVLSISCTLTQCDRSSVTIMRQYSVHIVLLLLPHKDHY